MHLALESEWMVVVELMLLVVLMVLRIGGQILDLHFDEEVLGVLHDLLRYLKKELLYFYY